MKECSFPFCKGCRYIYYDMGEFPMCCEPDGECNGYYCYDQTEEEWKRDEYGDDL